MIKQLKKNLSNAIGWRTKRKIVVLESDDWGSIRTKSKNSYDTMLANGLGVDKSNFTKFDCLESNADLEGLYQLLQQHKDSTLRSAVFTPMAVVANPDFNKIANSDFEVYHYENFNETCKRYPNHDKVHQLWLDGINKRLFVPQFHGREHLNVNRWLKALKGGDRGLRLAFEQESFGVSKFQGQNVAEHLAAFNPEKREDIMAYSAIIQSGGQIFEELCGYRPSYFVASNSSEPKCLEQDLKEIGVKYLTRYKVQNYPMGDGHFQREFNWLGKVNCIGQLIITRNCSFEPSDPSNSDWINACLAEVENAFLWSKPAVISTHRVNYVGGISEINSQVGLESLNTLLKRMIKKWPELEFMTSVELGDIIAKSRD